MTSSGHAHLDRQRYDMAVVELTEGFQGGLMAIAERKPIMGSGAEPELRGPGPRGPPVIRAL